MNQLYGINPRWLLYGTGKMGGPGTDWREQKISRLRTVRDELGLSQKAMEEMLGISAQYLGFMERGDQPVSVPVCMKVQDLFGYSASWILYEKGPRKIR